MENIRNFSIIAHIDHGKSTLADRIIQHSGVVPEREFRNQILDNMEIERERGITIKSQTINIPYKAKDGKEYLLNLIDTPGHVDFHYEVSRALASCEGVLLVIDASQGVEAQTIANLFSAMEENLKIIPVINKIDLPTADIDKVKEQIEKELALDPGEAILCSAKEGIGIEDILEAIVRYIPAPEGDKQKPLTALIFDATYDVFRGTIVSCRIFDGRIKPGDVITLMSGNSRFTVEETGIFRLSRISVNELYAGSVGYIIAGIKDVNEVKIGDTITLSTNPASSPLSGFRESKPVVFSSIYPVSSEDYESLKDALAKYKLNDAAFVYQKDSSAALGLGFRCGFLGLLHLEIVQERLETEFSQSVIMTIPTVQYRFTLSNDQTITIDNPLYYPDPSKIKKCEEPYVNITIYAPEKYFGAIMKVGMDRRGINSRFNYPRQGQVELRFEMPLSEVIFDFHDKLKSITQGYGSFDYEFFEYRESKVVKLDILINGEKIDALSMIIYEENAYRRAKGICEKLKGTIPKQQIRIDIQAAIGSKIISRSTISPFRKDVIAKCYGGDITRKRKLLEKQKEGKKKMKVVGSVVIPQNAFISVLKIENE
ncbi:MAG: translation elongation factor 4 [Candidatus Omnitrophica bacterium]|nr:translation elongation factor 4 [Candidatus Omnitrophota bacterium]